MNTLTIRETAEHRTAELALAQALGRVWRCDMQQMPPLAPFDYVARRAPSLLPVAVIELKIKHSRGAGDHAATVLLDVGKYATLRQAAYQYSCPALVVWYFARDGLAYFIDVENITPIRVEVVGRADRTEHGEAQPAFRIPLTQARRLRLGEI